MSRAVRIEYPGALYHVMSRGVARIPTFLDDEDRMCFLSGVERLVGAGELVVHAFCLMPNHLRQYSGQGATAIAEQYSRRHSAVAMAVKAIEAEASKSPVLASRLAQLFDTVMERKSDE